MSKIKVPKKTIGTGYSGLWNDGTLGWRTSSYPHCRCQDGSPSMYPPMYARTRFFRCRITVTPLRDKKGRPIVRYFGGVEP
jgi:hypothetical protein